MGVWEGQGRATGAVGCHPRLVKMQPLLQGLVQEEQE